ncbi:hypothetical protein C5C27_05080 [Rathayibacter sp. AY2B7]|nr:hypothetical protein C5C27_05080 [Rathayibacter sp. AY2B7]
MREWSRRSAPAAAWTRLRRRAVRSRRSARRVRRRGSSPPPCSRRAGPRRRGRSRGAASSGPFRDSNPAPGRPGATAPSGLRAIRSRPLDPADAQARGGARAAPGRRAPD